jgi:acetoin utilization protein AcuB
MKRSSVRESMSKKLITIRWDQPMEEAADLMEEHRFRHLPVADDSGVIVGILSDRDVNRAVNPGKPGFIADAQVSEYMSWPVITVDENLALRDAAQGMIDEKVSAFLVTDANKAIVGIVTSEDMLKALVKLLSPPSGLAKVAYFPVVGELLREAEAAGL